MMTATPTTSNADCRSCLAIRVCAPDGKSRTHELPFGQVLVVGTSPACGLRLDAPEIAGMHCTIEFNDAGITIRDWSTESGTFLNGHQIEEERLQSGAFEIRLGGYLLQSRPSTVGATKSTSEKPKVSGDVGEPISDEEGGDAFLSGGYQSILATEDEPASQGDEDGANDLQQDDFEEMTLADGGADESAWDRDFDPWDTIGEDVSARHATRSKRTTVYQPSADAHTDTAELLQAEVEFLRTELAERDERLRALEELAELGAPAEPSEDTLSKDEAEKLVARLEELLAELEQSDARAAALNEVLRTSEEAVQTADEERRQLEGWLSEVDRRVGQWEQEWQAERESLQKSISELTEQRDRAEHQVATGKTSDSGGAVRDQLVTRLREEYSRLKSGFLKMEQERDRLRSELQELSTTDAEQRVSAAVDASLREERLQLAQEKASLARDKSTLAKKQEELQAQLDRRAQSGESADQRIRAFREHLREIHENEPDRPQGATLSQRMGKLWRKLEGRPLDTD